MLAHYAVKMQLQRHTMLSSTRSVTFGVVSRGNISSAVASMADAGFGASVSVDGWAVDVTGGLCLLLVVGISIGVTPSSSSSRMELAFTQQADETNWEYFPQTFFYRVLTLMFQQLAFALAPTCTVCTRMELCSAHTSANAADVAKSNTG